MLVTQHVPVIASFLQQQFVTRQEPSNQGCDVLQHDIKLVRLRHCAKRVNSYALSVTTSQLLILSTQKVVTTSRSGFCAPQHSTKHLWCVCQAFLHSLLFWQLHISRVQRVARDTWLIRQSPIRLQYLMKYMLNRNCTRIRWNKEEQAKAVSTKSLQHLPAR